MILNVNQFYQTPHLDPYHSQTGQSSQTFPSQNYHQPCNNFPYSQNIQPSQDFQFSQNLQQHSNFHNFHNIQYIQNIQYSQNIKYNEYIPYSENQHHYPQYQNDTQYQNFIPQNQQYDTPHHESHFRYEGDTVVEEDKEDDEDHGAEIGYNPNIDIDDDEGEEDVGEVECEKRHKCFSDWQKDTFKHMPGDFLATPIFESKPTNPKNNDSSKLVFLGCWFKSKDECVLKISEKCFLDGYEYKVQRTNPQTFNVCCVVEKCL